MKESIARQGAKELANGEKTEETWAMRKIKKKGKENRGGNYLAECKI